MRSPELMVLMSTHSTCQIPLRHDLDLTSFLLSVLDVDGLEKKGKTRGRREGERSGGMKETEGVEGDGGRERRRRGRGREGRSGVRKNGERERERE